MAARRAVKFTLEMGVEKQLLRVTQILFLKKSSKPSFTLHGHLIHYVKLQVSHFSYINFSHVHRQENTRAHSLVRRTITLSNLLVWVEDVRLDILHIV